MDKLDRIDKNKTKHKDLEEPYSSPVKVRYFSDEVQ